MRTLAHLSCTTLLLILFAGQIRAQDCNVGDVTYCYADGVASFTYCPSNPATESIMITLGFYDMETNWDYLHI